MNGYTRSAEETEEIGRQLAETLEPGDVVCLFGDLGAGKTTFIRGIVSKFSDATVQSPTFAYLNIYEGAFPVYHFDLYRLKDSDAFLSMGFDEYMDERSVCVIEWSERIADLLPKTCIHIAIKHLGEGERHIEKVSV